MLDEYAESMGCKLHEAAAQMISMAYAEWTADQEQARYRGSLSSKGYGPFGRAS